MAAAAIRATRGAMLHIGSQSWRPRPTAGIRRPAALAALVARVSLTAPLADHSLSDVFFRRVETETALPCAEACPQKMAAQQRA